MEDSGGCLLGLPDFKEVFKKSLQLYEMQARAGQLFEGIHPHLEACESSNNNSKLDGYSGFESFFNSFVNKDQAVTFFDNPLSNPITSSQPSTHFSLSPVPSPPSPKSTKERACTQYYNYCFVNANWTAINQQECLNTTTYEGVTKSDSDKIGNNSNSQAVLISSLDYCPKLSTKTSTTLAALNTHRKSHITVTASYNNTVVAKHNETTTYNNDTAYHTNNNTNRVTTTSYRINNTTTNRVNLVTPRNNVTFERVTAKNNASFASLLIIPMAIIFIALLVLCYKKNSKLKHKRMMLQRTESNTTATTIMASYPQTPTSTSDLISFYINQKNGKEGGEKSKKKNFKTLRQDSELSNFTSSAESVSPSRQLDARELQQSHILKTSDASPYPSGHNLNEAFSTLKSSKSLLSSINRIYEDTEDAKGRDGEGYGKSGVGVGESKSGVTEKALALGDNLAGEWDKGFNSIIDWMNRSEMDLDQSES